MANVWQVSGCKGHNNDANEPIGRHGRKIPHTFASPYHGTGFESHPPNLASMTSRFETRKQKILEQLDAPDGEYHDLSPKGSIDAPIRELIGEINGFDGIVTTSSCSGRISVFLEGRKADDNASKLPGEGEESRAGPGGKGGGGTWLFISHDPVDVPAASSPTDFMSKFGLRRASDDELSGSDAQRRFVHLKFEPMVRSTYSVWE